MGEKSKAIIEEQTLSGDESTASNDVFNISETPIIFKKEIEKKKKGFFRRIFSSEDSITLQYEQPDVFARNITFIEKESFIDLLTSIGNIEIFIYMIELLANQNIVSNNTSHKIVI